MKLSVAVIIAVLFLAGGLYCGEFFSSNDAVILKENLGRFGSPAGSSQKETFLKYVCFYGMSRLKFDRYGYFLSHGQRIFTMSLSPEKAPFRGTVILLHGYLEHSGNLGEAAGRLLARGYRVILFDMPGHGLSDGDRGSIDDFGIYARTLGDIADMVRSVYPGPYDFIGHSTACAAALELLRERPDVFDRVVFIAPLVRPSFWGMIQAAYFLGSPFMRSIPRAYFDASGDREYREYLDFMENHDPLQVQEVPLRWVKALLDWNQRISNYKVIPKKINVIQGDADTVLDWKANLAILQERFSDVSPAMIPGGKHILFHETEKRKYLVFEKIWECLSEH